MKLTFKEKVGYGLGDTASNFVWAMMDFMLIFYTDVFKIDAAVAGALMGFARVFDGGVDFAMGAVADRTQTRWGKFRPYLLWMCVPLAVVFILTFTTPSMSDTSKIIYAWITYNLLMIFYTAINIPYSALSGVMTDDPLDRTSLNSYRMVLAKVGGFAVQGTLLLLVASIGGGDDAIGFQWTITIYALISTVLFVITFFTTRERIHPPATQKTNLLEDLKTLFRNPYWVIMFMTALVNMTFVAVRGGNLIFYCKYYLDWNAYQITAYMVFGTVSFMIGASLTRFVVKAIGKKWAFMLSMAGIALSIYPYYFTGKDQTVLLYLWQFLNGIAGGINATLFWTLVADTADFSEWKFNVRSTGVVFSATTCSQKIGLGIGAWIAGMVLTSYGYKPPPVGEAVGGAVGMVLTSSGDNTLPVTAPVVNVDKDKAADTDKKATPDVDARKPDAVEADNGKSDIKAANAEANPAPTVAPMKPDAKDAKKPEKKVRQTETAIHGIILLASVIPASAFLFLAFFFFLYGLDEDFLHKIRVDLNQRRAAAGDETTL